MGEGWGGGGGGGGGGNMLLTFWTGFSEIRMMMMIL